LSHQAVGIYSVVSQLGRYINDLYDACIQGLYPAIHISKSEFKATINILKIAIPIAVLISIIVYIFTPYIVSYLGLGGNEIAIKMVHIYLCVLPLQFLNNILGTSILNKNYIPIIILGGVTIVVANYFLVNLCGVIGTMWAFAIQTLINFLLICLFFGKTPPKY
jgi:O-antigen/teichoic acid export membrane protein